MLKVYISQPIRNQSLEQINTERDILAKNLSSIGHYVLNPQISEDEYKERMERPVEYLGRELIMLSVADMVVLMPGWQYNRICTLQELICKRFEIKTYKMTDDELLLRDGRMI